MRGREFTMGQEENVKLQTIPFDLGGKNVGTFGPTEADLPTMSDYVADLAKPEYAKPVSNEWICVDGRLSEEDLQRLEAGEVAETVPAQIAGSKVTTDVAAEFMNEPGTVPPRSE